MFPRRESGGISQQLAASRGLTALCIKMSSPHFHTGYLLSRSRTPVESPTPTARDTDRRRGRREARSTQRYRIHGGWGGNLIHGGTAPSASIPVCRPHPPLTGPLPPCKLRPQRGGRDRQRESPGGLRAPTRRAVPRRRRRRRNERQAAAIQAQPYPRRGTKYGVNRNLAEKIAIVPVKGRRQFERVYPRSAVSVNLQRGTKPTALEAATGGATLQKKEQEEGDQVRVSRPPPSPPRRPRSPPLSFPYAGAQRWEPKPGEPPRRGEPGRAGCRAHAHSHARTHTRGARRAATSGRGRGARGGAHTRRPPRSWHTHTRAHAAVEPRSLPPYSLRGRRSLRSPPSAAKDPPAAGRPLVPAGGGGGRQEE